MTEEEMNRILDEPPISSTEETDALLKSIREGLAELEKKIEYKKSMQEAYYWLKFGRFISDDFKGYDNPPQGKECYDEFCAC